MAARVVRYGQEAHYLDLDIERENDRAHRTHAAAAALRSRLPGADVVVGGGVVVVANGSISSETLLSAIEGATEPLQGKTHVIRAVYDGPDLEASARALGFSPDELVARHSANEVSVELVGFLPGFGYLGPIDPRLVLPRLPSPRRRVPAGSIGIAGDFTGIYPFDSPGGWNLIGRTDSAVLFDPNRDPPILFSPGDRVRFEPVAAAEAAPAAPKRKPFGMDIRPGQPSIFVESAPLGATVQDLGRPGQLGRGLPPSGPLDPEKHAAANEAVGNPANAATIEIPLGTLSIHAEDAAMLVSVDGETPVRIENGESFRVEENASAVRYLAVRGGIDLPITLGARATLLVARLGCMVLRGMSLPVGDAYAASAIPSRHSPPQRSEEEITTLYLDEGPHLDRFPKDALSTLLSAPYLVSRLGDRVGVRLDGPKIPRDRADLALPVPMVRGAIQVSTDGTPIVLGPDHPTTGGYPVLAVVRRASFGVLASQRPGRAVRFAIAPGPSIV